MWSFAAGLFLVIIHPDSLQLTAVYGLTLGASMLLFGALIGDWVDHTPRLRGQSVCLSVYLYVCLSMCLYFLLCI